MPITRNQPFKIACIPKHCFTCGATVFTGSREAVYDKDWNIEYGPVEKDQPEVTACDRCKAPLPKEA